MVSEPGSAPHSSSVMKGIMGWARARTFFILYTKTCVKGMSRQVFSMNLDRSQL